MWTGFITKWIHRWKRRCKSNLTSVSSPCSAENLEHREFVSLLCLLQRAVTSDVVATSLQMGVGNLGNEGMEAIGVHKLPLAKFEEGGQLGEDIDVLSQSVVVLASPRTIGRQGSRQSFL